MSNKLKFILLLEVLVIIAIPYMWSNNYIEKIVGGNLLLIWCWRFIYLLRIVFLFHVLLIILKQFYYKVIKSQVNEKKANRKLFFTSLISIFIFCEMIFSFIPQSQANGQVDLGQRLWQAYYGRNINELGYRDESIRDKSESSKKKLFFLGDSFTYGSGIEDENDRFSNIVAKKVSDEFDTYNLGKCQSDTFDEFKRLKEIEVKPDIVVLQYFYNDIIPTGMRYGYFDYREKHEKQKTKLLFAAIIPFKCSFFLNFLFVNLGNKIVDNYFSSWYKKDIVDSFNNENCINEHLNDLVSGIKYCKENNIKIYVLFIPELTDVKLAQDIYESKIVPSLNNENVECIFIADKIKNYSTSELVVNAVDIHANEFVQKIIAEKLLKSVNEFSLYNYDN